ncbi:MAG: hypothetical protein AAF721_30950 [Myxococcota bacterium]
MQWSADSLIAEAPAGRDCELVNAELDFEDFSEGVASMRVESPVGDVQGAMGCVEFGQETLTVDWNSGEWLCMYFDMKIDGDFNWDSNQRKFKMQRMVNSGSWTMYLNEWGVDISECSKCEGCSGGDQCTTMNYDMRPARAGGENPVEQWQSYTVGVRLESGGGAADGGMRLWVDGVLADSADDRVYCPDIVGAMVGACPDGTIWLDDFLFTAGPDECTPRP